MLGEDINQQNINDMCLVGFSYRSDKSLAVNLVERPWYYIDASVGSVYHGIDWIYTTIESFSSFEFHIWYFKFFTSIFDDSFDFFFISYWYLTTIALGYELLWSSLSDSYFFSTFLPGYYTDYWFQSMLGSRDLSLVFIYHPESLVIAAQVSNSSMAQFWEYCSYAIYEFIEVERLYLPTCVLMHFLYFFMMIMVLVFVYFSYFTSTVKEEATIDYDYAVATSSVEAEKEITGFDDIVLGFVSIFLIVCWYFYVHFWMIVTELPELLFFWYIMPWLVLLIVGVPLSLAYDFGVIFLAYLRGVGSTPLMLYELMFDYISVVIFFTRIVIQLIRVVLILFAYITMHDFILYEAWTQRYYVQYEDFWEELAQVSFTFQSVSYYIVFTLINRITYWMYEVLHTFFVVTAQCVAFFAIVFWLYLFLYTMFIAVKHENYFSYKRLIMKKFNL